MFQGVRAEERRMEAREAAEARSASKAERGVRSKETRDRNASSTQAERAAEVRGTNKSERGARSRETQEPNPSSTQSERTEVRATNKSDRGTQSRETQEQNPSATPAERANASPSEAQAQDGSRSSDDMKRVAEDSKAASEATSQPSQAGVDAQGPAPMLLASLVSSQVPVQANDQTNLHTEGEGEFSEGEQGSEREAESDAGSSRSPSILPRAAYSGATVSALPDSQSHSDGAPHGRPAHEPDAPVIHTGGDSPRAQVVKLGSPMVADNAAPETANPVETRSVPLESQSGSTLPQPEVMVRRISPASIGMERPDGKPEIPKTDPVIREGVSADRAAPAQLNWYTQSLRDAQDNGARMQWGFQQGQQSGFDGAERFSELWSGQQSLHHDPSEMKLPQAMVSERQVSGGPPPESMMAGVQGRVGSSPPPPPTPPVVNQVQPSMPTHDAAESSVRFMTRSVVFDVARPDLGHVNIRVAMANDVVHTHLSADRLEVGQFLVNGQDRLQAAFQANGLDMGQFRVDIDRQSAGRSFQQDPSSQEQGQTWNQGSPGMKWGQSPDRQDEPRASLHGLLNVVA